MKYHNSMKVAHFIATLDLGGAEVQLLTLCKAQVAHGYQVSVFPLKGSNLLADKFQIAGVQIVDILRNKSTLTQYLHLLFFSASLRTHILHTHSAKIQILFSSLPFPLKSRLVFSKHDAMQFIVKAPKFVSKYFWRWCQRRASIIILISNSIKSEMNLRGESLDQSKAVTSHYGISESEINEIKESGVQRKRREGRVSKKNIVIGTVGRLVKEKNHLFLIEVFQQLLMTNPETTLVICGYGPLEDNLRQEIEKRHLHSKVKILNNIENAREVYSEFDLFILPSTTEGFGLVLLEAMAAELPIIASNIGAIPEVLGVEYEFLFKSGNQRELLEMMVRAMDKSTREKKSIESKVRLKFFTSEVMFTRIDSIYKSLN